MVGKYTKMQILFWWNFRYWLHRKLSKRQLPVQPVTKTPSKWRHFGFSVITRYLYLESANIVWTPHSDHRSRFIQAPSLLSWYPSSCWRHHDSLWKPVYLTMLITMIMKIPRFYVELIWFTIVSNGTIVFRFILFENSIKRREPF